MPGLTTFAHRATAVKKPPAYKRAAPLCGGPLRGRAAVRSTDNVIHRSMSGVLALVAGIALATGAIAQNRSVYAPPTDLASPPADAIKSPSGLISKVLTPGKGDEKP